MTQQPIVPTRRTSPGRGPGRGAVAALAALVVAVASLAPSPSSAPAAAATATMRKLRTIDVSLNAVHDSPGTPEYFSSPALADLDGDDEPEVVVAAPNGTITATRLTTGARMWQRGLGATAIQASPLVVDIDRNGTNEVVAATMDGRVVLLNGQTGGVIRTFRQGPPLYCPGGSSCRPTGFFATPVVGDVNGDGRLDIVAASFDHSLYAWSYGGTLLWRAFLYDTLWSSPVIADVNRDGRNEVVVGGDIYAGNPLGVPAGGLMWVLHGSNGSRFPGYPKSLPGQTIWSSPVVTDLDGDNRPDVVVGTGTYGPFGNGTAARRVWAFNLGNRANLPGWPVTAHGRVMQQPAVGDIDGDGRREVVVGTETGYVQAFEHNGAQKWITCNASLPPGGCNGNAVGRGGVVIADVDSDGVQEVVSTLAQYLRVYDGRNKTMESEYRLEGGSGNLHPPSVAAIGELQGRTIIVQAAIFRADASGHPAPGDRVRTNVVTTDEPLCAEDWPAFKGGPRRSSVQPTLPPWQPFACGRPFVAQQYLDLLGRPLDAAGQDYWTARLRSGLWSGARVVQGFMASPEFGGTVAPIVRVHLGLSAGAPGPSAVIRDEIASVRQGTSIASIAQARLDAMAPMTDGELVDTVFPRLVGAAPTTAQRNEALDTIASDGQGAWVAEVASSEWVVARLRNHVQVAFSYIGLLDRAPDAGGWTYWVNRVNGGTSAQRLIELFLASSEYADRVS